MNEQIKKLEAEVDALQTLTMRAIYGSADCHPPPVQVNMMSHKEPPAARREPV